MKKRAAGKRTRKDKVVGTVGGKLSGPVKGVPASPAAARAARTNAWKHGEFAKSVTEQEVAEAKVSKLREDAPEIIAAYTRAIEHGEMEALNPVAIAGMSQTEILRRDVFDRVLEDGVIIRETLVNSEGMEVGEKLKAHPGLQELRWMNEQAGHTVTDLQLSKKSRDDGALGQAAALMMKKTAALRAADKSFLPAPDRNLLGKGA